MEPILVATPKFVDFGEVHFAPKVHSAIATIVLTNKSAFDTIVVQVGEADSTQVDYPVNVRVVPEEFDVTKSLFVFSEKSEGEQVVLLPGLSKSCKVMFYSSSKLDSGHLRTSFFKVSSSIFLPYYVQRGERPENLSLVIPYSASLCTSILFTEDTELLFENCELDREYSRNIQIWNRSESVLSYSVTFHDNLEDFGTNEVSFYEQESEEIIRIGSSYSIEPFASKRLSIRMLAKVSLKKCSE